MPFIVNSLIEKKLALGREEFVRKHGYGGQWKKLRIGVHCNVNGNVAFNGYASGLGVIAKTFTWVYFGVCQDIGYWNPAGTLDALVVSPIGTVGNAAPLTLNTSANTPGYWSSQTNPGRIIWKTGTTENLTTAGSTGIYGACAPNRMNVFADFTLNGNNTATVQFFGPANSAHALTDISTYQFLQNIEVDSPGNNQNVGSWIAPTTFNYQGNYNLNSVLVAWERSQPTWDICELCVLRLY